MKPNREKVTALLAALVLTLGLWSVVMGFMAPSRGLDLPEITIPKTSREVLSRRYRRFPEEGRAVEDPGRNPFSFSEGWQSMETTPLLPPPIPEAPRPLPFLGGGDAPLEGGFLYQDRAPAELKGGEGSP
jgi:hypothetical protein